ncbi:MAG: hypothetical protein WC455_09480 [Dehalococcoidia bacterium]|jgi:hypothetical protein
MPVNVVKTPKDEALWAAAKEQAQKAGHSEDWPYIMGIFQKMKGEDPAKTASILRARRCGAIQVHEAKRAGIIS